METLAVCLCVIGGLAAYGVMAGLAFHFWDECWGDESYDSFVGGLLAIIGPISVWALGVVYFMTRAKEKKEEKAKEEAERKRKEDEMLKKEGLKL